MQNKLGQNAINVTLLPSNIMFGINFWQFNTEDNKHIWGIDFGFIFFSINYSRLK
jgi:hypothetical protein